jgi:anti-anti-sigma regulatory factor
MLRITVIEDPKYLTLQLEGRLSGPWVHELEASWQKSVADRTASDVRIDLEDVTFVDGAGKALLAAIHNQGAKLVASCCLTKGIVADIARAGQKRKEEVHSD